MDAVPANGTDGELTVWSPTSDQLWEFWKAHKESDGWHACWGGRIDAWSRSPGYFEQGMGASASGLALAPGVIGIKEMQQGWINHALRIGLPQIANYTAWSYPAQRSDGKAPAGEPNAIMEGQRFRLDPSLDVSSLGLTPIATAVARSAQKYGFIVTDGAGTLTISTESGQAAEQATGTNPWTELMDGTPAYRIMKDFPWSRLQALPVDYGKWPEPNLPKTAIVAGPSGWLLRTSGTFSFSSSAPGSTFQCLLDGDGLPCSGDSIRLTGLSPGSHRFSVTAVTSEGLRDATPAVHRFAVPVDDSRLRTSGEWKRKRLRSAFRGTYTETSRANAMLKFRVTDARELALLVRGKRYGKVNVYFKHALLVSLRTRGRAGGTRVIDLAHFSSPRSGTVRIVTTSNRKVKIDGLAESVVSF